MTTKTKTTAENGNADAVQKAVDKAVAKAGTRSILELNVEDLDLADCIDVEEITGEPILVTFAGLEVGQTGAKALAALVWVAKRKEQPSFTFEEAKRTKVMHLGGVLTADSDAGKAQG